MAISRRKLGLMLVIVVVIGTALVVQAIAWGGAVRIDYYRVVDPHTLVIGAETGKGEWARVASVVETSSTVTITVRSLRMPLPQGGSGLGIEFVVNLANPIGSRTVVDASRSQVVEFTRCLPPTPLREGCL